MTEEQARQAALQKPSVEDLLKQLQDALKDQDHIGAMWPDARLKDREMFSHLNLSFDLTNDKVTVETAAKDYHGKAHYQYIYDTDYHTAVEVTNIDDNEVPEAPTTSPVAAPVV